MPMPDMRRTNWVGMLMFIIFLVLVEPIWSYLSSDTASILWVIPAVGYVIVALALLMRGVFSD